MAVHTCASPFTCYLQHGQRTPGLGVSLIPQFCRRMGLSCSGGRVGAQFWLSASLLLRVTAFFPFSHHSATILPGGADAGLQGLKGAGSGRAVSCRTALRKVGKATPCLGGRVPRDPEMPSRLGVTAAFSGSIHCVSLPKQPCLCSRWTPVSWLNRHLKPRLRWE